MSKNTQKGLMIAFGVAMPIAVGVAINVGAYYFQKMADREDAKDRKDANLPKKGDNDKGGPDGPQP